jgi:hypothetical protein
VEIAEQTADKAGKERAREPPKEVEEELILNTPERPTTPVRRKRTYTLVERTPGKLPTPGPPAPGPALQPSRLPSPSGRNCWAAGSSPWAGPDRLFMEAQPMGFSGPPSSSIVYHAMGVHSDNLYMAKISYAD